MMINTITYAIYTAMNDNEEFTINGLFRIFVKIGLIISISTIAYKIIQQLSEKVLKFNNGKPLTQDQNAVIVTSTLGITIFEIQTKLYEISDNAALTSAIISSLITFLINSTIISKLLNLLNSKSTK